VKLVELNMTSAQITRSIRLGWGGAALSAVATLFLTFIFATAVAAPLVVWALASAAVTAALGYGVYRRSRWAAVTLLVMFVISRVWYYVQTGALGSPLLSIIFLYCFVEGVRGTLAHRRVVAGGTTSPDASAA
jgi:hypothetical protein